MARYRQLLIHDGTSWCLMSPSNALEAVRIAWMLWRHPERVAALVGVPQEFMDQKLTREPYKAPVPTGEDAA